MSEGLGQAAISSLSFVPNHYLGLRLLATSANIRILNKGLPFRHLEVQKLQVQSTTR